MKITVLLRNDHEALRALFERFRKPGARKEGKDLFSEIRREILIHSQMESEIFYPALAATSSAHATELVSRATREHRAVERLLAELHTMSGPDKNFDAKMD